MVKRFFIWLVVALIFGAAGTFFIVQAARNRQAEIDAAQNLKKGDISITVIEGKRREEIAKQLENAGITSAAQFLLNSAGQEGTLFPDTYRFFPNTPAKDVVDKMRANYATRLDIVPTKDQLILASIVEREAGTDADRAVIAGVYMNRLKIGMTLDADPTVQYAKDTITASADNLPTTFIFWGSITKADYRSVNSAFNTYLHAGLPPGPICNPGKKSIDAAMNPAVHDFYFFFTRGDKIFLSKTKAEHDAKLAANPS
jgi:UPF0755 protein